MIGANKLDILRLRVKEAFDVAVAMGVYRPEGVAIMMQSGIILTGYTQFSSKGNAASDALRTAIPCFPTEDKPDSKILDHFSIAAVLVLTQRKHINPVTLTTLREYPEVVASAPIYHARLGPADTGTYVSVQETLSFT